MKPPTLLEAAVAYVDVWRSPSANSDEIAAAADALHGVVNAEYERARSRVGAEIMGEVCVLATLRPGESAANPSDHAAISAVLDILRQRDEVLADCAAMREALERIGEEDAWEPTTRLQVIASAALEATDAGAALLREFEALRDVAEAVRCDMAIETRPATRAAIVKLDALRSGREEP